MFDRGAEAAEGGLVIGVVVQESCTKHEFHEEVRDDRSTPEHRDRTGIYNSKAMTCMDEAEIAGGNVKVAIAANDTAPADAVSKGRGCVRIHVDRAATPMVE